MHKPNSAIERIKNHLAYKLGKVMIDFSHQRNNYKYGGGYIALFKKLYKIKKQHKKEQKIYQQTIQVFPQLKYPNLETCSDYEQALKYKFHLSYMLGEVLIQTFQNLHKGSMFKLAKNIKKANREFKIFKEIFNDFAKLSPNIVKVISKNKQLFLKEFSRIQNILKIHQDYQPILDNIFHNFNYFIQKFNLIEEWLLSNDFNEKYKKENHPYPSLLDPKKLNDEKEKINYKNIPAELAWEINLPLPDNYEFVFLSAGVSGHAAMVKFLEDCNCRLFSKYSHRGNNIFGAYCDQYAFLNKKGFNILTFFEYGIVDYKLKSKFIGLFNSKKRVLFLVRDPIERLKSRINHIAPNKFAIYDFNLNSNVKEIVNVKKYYSKNGINDFPDINILENLLTFNFFCYKLLIDFFRKSHIFYIDMEEIKPAKAFDTMCVLADKFGFKRPVDKINFSHIVFDDTIGYFPMRLHVEDMIIIITTLLRAKQMRQSKEYINFTKEFFDKPLKYENLGIFLKPQEFGRLKQDSKLFDVTKRYLNNFIEALEERIDLEKAKLFKEKDVLNYLKENKELRVKLKNILDKELVHIKQHRPDIVASWKYYQEFEKMCKELDDGDIYEKDL
ncbi:sugar transferase [Campylobacter jejuni]|nr:sugar transferase [Campylobacter jejuni]